MQAWNRQILECVATATEVVAVGDLSEGFSVVEGQESLRRLSSV